MGDWQKAIEHYKDAINADKKFAPPHYSWGEILVNQKDWDGAILHLQEAVNLEPKNVQYHYGLGNALRKKMDFEAAVKQFEKTLSLNPNHAEVLCDMGLVLQDLGRFAEAVAALKKGHALGSARPDWRFSSAKWLQETEQLLALDEKLTAIQQGKAVPKDAFEQLALANLCRRYKKLYVTATGYYTAAFTAQPGLIGKNYFMASRAALLAAAGQGKDAASLNDKDKENLRRQALSWLKTELVKLGKQVQAGGAAADNALKALKFWHEEADFASVREAKELAKLPPAERQAWEELWADVGKLLRQPK
jgi:tetratricopeptide (TPR) repeat protein